MNKQILLVLVLLSCKCMAQTEAWFDLNLYKKMNERLTLFGDGGPRLNVEGESISGFYIRPSASFQLSKKVMIAGGLAWFYAQSNDNHANEFRGWQGIRYEQRVFDRVLLSNYTRLEERSLFSEGKSDFLLRFRTLFGATFLLNRSTVIKNTWYIPLAYEIFEDLNDHQTVFINRQRFYTGIGYGISDRTRLEIFYIANDSRPGEEDNFKTVNVIRMRLHITLPERSVLID